MRRIATLLALTLGTLALGCSQSKREIHAAQHSQYDADFATVYSAALSATRDLYPNLDDNPGAGWIKTSWHPVQYAATQDDQQGATPTNNLGGALGQPTFGQSPASGAAGMPMHLASKRFFIRFDVSVVGGRPWRVKVVGHASSWDVGAAMPVELHGIARPAWLSPRVEALQVEIYKRVKKFAVPMPEEEGEKAPTDDSPKTDPSQFKDLPAEAGKALAQLKDTLSHRDLGALRPLLADDVVWSLGGAPGADTAMAMWQADPDSLDTMARLVTTGCAAVSATRIECPAKAPVGQWQLVLESRSGAWKVASFIKVEQQ